MGLHIFWPASAILTLFVVGVIMIILKHGSRMCRLRHHALPAEQDWHGRSYSQDFSISVSVVPESVQE